MVKMTMQQELEKLQTEVARLKKQQATVAKKQASEAEINPDDDTGTSSEGGIEATLESLHLPGMDKDLRQQAHDLIKQLGEEYENLSPAMVVVIFSLGALFGRSLSSK